MQAVILAAGKGKRLGSLSLTRSKAMMPVAGKPIVERVLDGLAENGLEQFIVVVSPNDSLIRPYLAHSRYAGIVTFVEQPEQRGMADALQRAAPHLKGDFLLSACDNLVEPKDIGRLLSLWNTEPKPLGLLSLLAVSPQEVPHTGIVALRDGWVTQIIEKPSLAEAPSRIASIPLYIFSPRILGYLSSIRPSERSEYELQDAIQMLIETEGNVKGMQVSSRKTLTDADNLLALNLFYLAQEQPGIIQGAEIGPGSRLHPPYLIEPGATVGRNCDIGPNVFIEGGSVIQDETILRDAVVLRGNFVLKKM